MIEDLRNFIRDRKEVLSLMEESPEQTELYIKGNISAYGTLELHLGILAMVEGDYAKCKQHFFTRGLIDHLLVDKYNRRIFDYALPFPAYPLVSDHRALIKSYAQLRYEDTVSLYGKERILHMDEMVLKTRGAEWVNTTQQFMAEDIEGIERNLNLLELSMKRKVNYALRFDYAFYRALYEKDKGKCEEALAGLLTKRMRKTRASSEMNMNIYSDIALCYAKLAWYCGVEVDLNSPLVPQALLPIDPLPKYEQVYDFLEIPE